MNGINPKDIETIRETLLSMLALMIAAAYIALVVLSGDGIWLPFDDDLSRGVHLLIGGFMGVFTAKSLRRK